LVRKDKKDENVEAGLVIWNRKDLQLEEKMEAFLGAKQAMENYSNQIKDKEEN